MLNQMYDQYKDRAEFYVVYIQEAHPTDIWQMQSNIKEKVLFSNPTNNDERVAVASSCVRNLHLKMPAILDPIDNATEHAYTGWPDRLYVIDRDGKIAYKSKPGPFGFNPKDMEDPLKKVL